MYIIDFRDIITKLVPKTLRHFKWLSFLYALVKPLQTLNAKFVKLSEDTDYRLQFTGQVIYLEHYLNDLYDPFARRIYIEDTANVENDYLYNKVELKPKFYVYNKSENRPTYIVNKSELAANNDFIVFVPTGIIYEELVMRSQIDQYKLAGKNYSIQTF